MPAKQNKSRSPAILDVVALLADAPDEGLCRGQVGIIVEWLDARNVLVNSVTKMEEPTRWRLDPSRTF